MENPTNPIIFVTGDNGYSLPPPYGGIMKRCLMHAKHWRSRSAEVYLHVYHRHEHEDDLGAKVNYIYDFFTKPSRLDKVFFVGKNFLRNPWLFLKLLWVQIKVSPKLQLLPLFCAGRGVFLEKQLKLVRPDIIITETAGYQSLVSLIIARRNKLPVILINSAEVVYKLGKGGENIADRYHKLWRKLLNEVDLVISSSEHCSQGPKKYLRDTSRLKIVYSGVDFAVFNHYCSVSDKKMLRNKFSLPKDKFIITAVGALRVRKGHDQLFEALLQLPDYLDKIHLVLCGTGNMEEIEQKIAELKFPRNKINFLHGLSEDDLAQLYAASDCFCFPSVTPRECMGLALKEAMSVGLPVAAYNAGGIGEAITEGINGFLAPIDDRKALASAILSVFNLSAEEKDKMRLANNEKAGRLFDIKKTAEQIYQEALQLINNKN